MHVTAQLKKGLLVSPKSHQKLIQLENNLLVSEDNQEKYQLIEDNIPVLFIENEQSKQIIQEASTLQKVYQHYTNRKQKRDLLRSLLKYRRDFRNPQAKKACDSIFAKSKSERLFLSIGGGPTRAYPHLVNVNIGLFPNVDIIADAHALPYQNNTVDGIHCEAVLEHLRDPQKVVQEMYRVLKPGGKVYACTPFLQPYHGYPHHYQNFTLTGHQHLFASNRFNVIEAGTAVGPVHTLLVLVEVMINEYLPVLIRKPLSLLWRLLCRFLYPLDRLLNIKDNAYIMASATYIVAEKN